MIKKIKQLFNKQSKVSDINVLCKSWEDVTYTQFNQIMNILASDNDTFDKQLYLLEVITDKSYDYFIDSTICKLQRYLKLIDFITKTEFKPVLKYVIKHNDTEYIPTFNIKNITAAQLIDYTNTLKDDIDNHTLLMAIICVPKGKSYGEGYDILELAESFKDLKYCEVLGVSSFFQLLLKALSTASHQYSIRQLKKELKKEKDMTKKELIKKSIIMIQESIKEMNG